MQNTSFSGGKTKNSYSQVDNLLQLFGAIHNHIYANEGYSPQEAFFEMLKILFLKIEDEKRALGARLFYIAAREKEMLSEGRKAEFVKRLHKLLDTAIKDYPDVFSSHDKLLLKPATLSYIVERLQGIELSKTEKDVKGMAFQRFIFASQRGDRGQFFTPEPILKMCTEFIAPNASETILDPASGSGGFLIEAMRYRNHNSKSRATSKNQFVGIEIAPSVARLAKMRMILEGSDHLNIVIADGLGPLAVLSRAAKRSGIPAVNEAFDIILTNPPFGTQGKIMDSSILGSYALGHRWEKTARGLQQTADVLRGQVPEILFIERCLSLLKPGGRMAIVLPNGELENSSLEYVRQFIKDQADVLASVSLPAETFVPYGTAVKASVLFLQKKSKGVSLEDVPVFLGRVTKIGYEGNKNGTVTYKTDGSGTLLRDSNGAPLIDEDVSQVIAHYKEFRQKGSIPASPSAFTVPRSEFTTRFDAEFYAPEYRLTRRLIHKHQYVSLGEVVEIVKARSPKLKDKAATITYVELADVNTAYNEIMSASEMPVHAAPSRATYELHSGDIITAVAGNSIGTRKHATALVGAEYDGAICTNGFRILRPKAIHPHYLLAYLRSNLFLTQVFQARTGAAIPALSDESLGSLLVPLLPKKQQDQIIRQIEANLELRAKLRDSLNKLSLDQLLH